MGESSLACIGPSQTINTADTSHAIVSFMVVDLSDSIVSDEPGLSVYALLCKLSICSEGDAGRVAGELGNTPAIVHRHYRELVKINSAKLWFSIVPLRQNMNVLSIVTD